MAMIQAFGITFNCNLMSWVLIDRTSLTRSCWPC